MTSILFRSISFVILALAVLIPTLNFAQESDVNGEAFRHRIVADDSVVFFEWAGLKGLRDSGSPAEDWLGQAEIQEAWGKLSKAIEGYQQANPMDEELLGELLIKAPEILRDCPATLHLTGYDEKYPDWSTGSTIIVVELGEHEGFVRKTIDGYLSEEKEKKSREFKQHKFDSGTIYGTGKVDEPNFGILAGNFVFTAGAIPIEEILANLKTPAPEITKGFGEKLSVERPFLNAYANTMELIKQIQDVPDPNYDWLKLDEIESFSASIGLDKKGVVSSFFLKCPEKPTGILSVFNTKPLEQAHIADMPDGSISSAGARLPLANIFEQIKKGAKATGAEDQLAYNIESIENLTELKFAEEILDSFDGTLFAYQKLTNANIVSLRVKDKAQFAGRMAKALKTIRIESEAVEGGQFSEKDYKGYTIYSFQQPVYLGPSLSWCLADDEFFVGASANMISSHLRRRGRTRGRLIDDQRFKDSFELGTAKGWGNPIFFSHIDIATTMQLAIPLVRTLVGQQSIDGFDFTFDDLPSVEILSNGVEANTIAVFRTPKGIRGVESSTIPGLSSVGTTGILVGMLLPAVQQVRAAARRVTAQNNLRQLQLAVLNYESANRRLPAAYSTDAAGKPLLSWRVHVLPYLEQQELYEKFRLDEPWDSEHNIELLDQMPEVFQHPNSTTGEGRTNFLAVTGKDGAFPGAEGLKIGSFTDGTSNVISLVGVNAEHAVNWTEPVDFDPANHDSLVTALQGNDIGIDATVVMVDGSVHVLDDVDETNLRQMMNRGDGKGEVKQE